MQHKYDDLSPGVSYKSKMNQPKQSEIVDLSSDDDESDDEVHHFEASIVIDTSLSLLYYWKYIKKIIYILTQFKFHLLIS